MVSKYGAELVRDIGWKGDTDNRDTDGDGVEDGDDPYPLDRVHTHVAKKSPVIDGKMEDGEWDLAAEFEDTEGKTIRLYLNWGETNLYVAFARPMDSRDPVKLQIDVTGDGWFRGRDNVELWPTGMGASASTRDYTSKLTGEWGTCKVESAGQVIDDLYVVEAAIPVEEVCGVKLEQGKQVLLGATLRTRAHTPDAPVFFPSFVRFDTQ